MCSETYALKIRADGCYGINETQKNKKVKAISASMYILYDFQKQKKI